MHHHLVLACLIAIGLSKGHAGESDTWQQPRCEVADGLALWNKEHCLLEQGFFAGQDGKPVFEARLHFEGKVIVLDEERERISVVEDGKIVKRPGPKPKWAVVSDARTFSRNGIRLAVRLREVGKCDYANQCTVANYRALFELTLPGRPVIKFEGVGYEGS